ncbi:DUF4192 domain-containing protein [Streptomyces sp. TRM 70351]|uniref:DUF4192 domain-containing protein n=1 Tax=Streptomyces sp. TRM 70351 TaxID=3116552 RepID=UPI002E7C0924|nr:DUF4192 domain-containing protein [Streptomyces sp. TRM 70351]MEE1926634.1 DUF4192 domain-containing protein [Streptomyces sp. TRM 70351]
MTHSDRYLALPGPHQPLTGNRVTLRGPAELADALPYLLGYHPDDSIVVVAVHGENGRFGGRVRLGIPSVAEEWPGTARDVAACLLGDGGALRDRPRGVVLYLCQDPHGTEEPQDAMERLRPLARELRTAFGVREVPVYDALCVSAGRFWSYCCPDPACCPPAGTALGPPGTSAMAAAAAYAGITVQGTLKELTARLAPLGPPLAARQERALDAASTALVPLMCPAPDGGRAEEVRARTLLRAARLLDRFRAAPPEQGGGNGRTDAHDDGLVTEEEAADLIVGLQDRRTRDRAAEWMEGDDAEPALRMWRALSRRCPGAYAEHAAAPLTLAGWVAWSSGDEVGARVALGQALAADPECFFAQLLHSACNSGLDPEALRTCLREQRAAHTAG